jgi:hypothetical protein
MDIIVASSDVELSEACGIFYPGDEFRDEREKVAISDSPFINFSVVLDRSWLAILHFDEEERGSVRAFRWSNVTLLLMFFYELFKSLLFSLS